MDDYMHSMNSTNVSFVRKGPGRESVQRLKSSTRLNTLLPYLWAGRNWRLKAPHSAASRVFICDPENFVLRNLIIRHAQGGETNQTEHCRNKSVIKESKMFHMLKETGSPAESD